MYGSPQARQVRGSAIPKKENMFVASFLQHCFLADVENVCYYECSMHSLAHKNLVKQKCMVNSC